MITIGIADDHPVVLDGLEALFRKEEGFKIVARCQNAEEALQAVIQKKPDILLLDVRMPGKDGLWVLEQLGDRYPTKVILLTGIAEEREIAKALKLGARGVVLKHRTMENLMKCIREVLASKRWIDEEVLNGVIDLITRSNSREQTKPVLSPREFEIIQLVAQGLRNKEIAKRLSISEETVKTYLRTVFQKLSVSGRMQLAAWARKHGLD